MKILMINYFEGGAGIVLYDLHKLNKNSEYVNVYSKLNFIPLKFRFMLAKLIAPFYSLILQITNNYDEVIMNNNIVIPIGRNSKCVYKNIIHHPFIYDIELHNRKKTFFTKMLLLHEKISVIFCKNVLTVSNFSKKKLLEYYKNINCEIISLPINETFINAKKIYKGKKEKQIFIPILYRENRKGGDFITPVLIKLAPELKKRKIKIIITGKMVETQKQNYNLLYKHCDVKSLGNISIEEVAKLYSTSLIVLTPAIFEGYGLIPLEVQAAGGKCISAPFPSLGFDNVSVNNPKRKVIIDKITVLEHDNELWEKEILNIVEKI